MIQVMNSSDEETPQGFGARSQSMPMLSPWVQIQCPSPPQCNVSHQWYHPPNQTNSNEDTHKRGRGLNVPSDGTGHQVPPENAVEQQKYGKRSRGNAYIAPREVKHTVTSAIGSLVGGTLNQTNQTVKMRRQLSGSQLDQFLSHGVDLMDEDPKPSRERAMSF